MRIVIALGGNALLRRSDLMTTEGDAGTKMVSRPAPAPQTDSSSEGRGLIGAAPTLVRRSGD
jgi:hypothetical protein